MTWRALVWSAALSGVVWACGDDSARPEVLDKLRGIGAATTPLVSTPSVAGEAPRQVEVTVHAALPVGETATVEPYVDLPSPFGVSLGPADIIIDPSPVYTTYAGFQVLTFKASLSVPPAERFAAFGGAGQARYGFLLKSGSEEEKLVGSFLVYPEGAPELAWSHPEITVVAPTDGAALGSGADVDLVATLTDKNDEDLKLGWFASGGEIMNRRAKETSWETPAAGDHTLIFTARGRKSRGFAMQIVAVTTE